MSSSDHQHNLTQEKRTKQHGTAPSATVHHHDDDGFHLLGTPHDWPLLSSTTSTARLVDVGRDESVKGQRVEQRIFDVEADGAQLISEEIGPRTRHRKPKSKPGVPFKVLKARAAADYDDDDDGDEDGEGLAPIAVLPTEILARIFAHLDARSIMQCAGVCLAFSSVAHEEATWRLAFSLTFGIECQSKTPILRRVDVNSWKRELFQRTELLRRWRKARSPTVLCDARIGPIQTIALSLPHSFMLCASLTYGVASRCDPFTGKVAKGFLDSSGQVNAVGLGAMAANVDGPEVSAMRLEADATRIIWGFTSGAVAMTNLTRQGTNPRGAIRGIHFSSRASHRGPVLDIAVPFAAGCGGAHGIERSPERIRQRQAMLGEVAETFVTCGMDGRVQLWSSKKAMPLWSDVAKQDQIADGTLARPTPVVRLAFHVESGTIVAATLNGDRTMWTNIDIAGLVNLPASAFEVAATFAPSPDLTTSRQTLQRIMRGIKRVDLPKTKALGAQGSCTPEVILLDVAQSGPVHARTYGVARLLTLCDGASSFERLSIGLQSASATSSDIFTVPYDDTISCLRPDFDLLRPSPTLGPTVGVVSANASSTASDSHRTPLSEANGGVPLYTERKFVCAGTREGRLVIWDWEEEATSYDAGKVRAWTCLDAHHTSITAIDLAEHVICVGCSDGTVKVFCPLSGNVVRTLNDRTATRHPARMLAAGQLTDEEASRFHVSQIIIGSETIVACIGAQVLAWRAERLRTKGSGGKKATSRTGRHAVGTVGGRLWDPKMQSMKEMERDVYETQQQLQKEHEERLADRNRLGAAPKARSELDGLTEQEAFEYAMMLSRDEMEARRDGQISWSSRSIPTSSEAAELESALEQIAREESQTDVFNAHDPSGDHGDYNSRSSSGCPSPDPARSPYLTGIASPPSRAWDILQNAGSSASRNTRVGDVHSKVQAVHVPRMARLPSTYSAAGTDASSRRASTSASQQQAESLLQSPHKWPPIDHASSASVMDRSPSRLELGSPVPFARQVNPSSASSLSLQPSHTRLSLGGAEPTTPSSPPLLSCSISARGSPMGAWAHGSPSLLPINSARSAGSGDNFSALSSTRPKPTSGSGSSTLPTAVEQPQSIDDDIRFALELSLAEERSRQEGRQPVSGGKGKATDTA